MTTSRSLAAEIGFDLAEDWNAARLLWDNLARNPDAVAVRHEAETWTYADLVAEAARIGNHLRRHAEPGQRVMLFVDDEPCYPAAIMGAMRAGLVPMLINTLSTPDLIGFFLEDSSARVVICSDAFAGMFSTCGLPVLTCGDRPWADEPDDLPEHPVARTDMAFWMYSSGSTGRPKGVVHKHEDIAYIAASYGQRVLGITAQDCCFSVPKIFFAYGFGNSVVFPMSVGGSAVLMSGRPTPDRVFDAIGRYRPTILFGLPTVYTALIHAPEVGAADLGSVRLCISAAEVLSAELSGTWRDRFGHAIIEGLGSTEMLHIYLSNDIEAQRHGSAGKVVPGYAVRLLTQEGTEAAPGEEGVMQVMGLSGAEYYWNRPDKTAETMQDGWLNTGDRFVMDADGFYYFRGRADDLVKVSGQWVYPMEIELALNEHPDVVECCVLAVPLDDGRMTLKAWVTPKGSTEGLAARLNDHAKSALLPHKYSRDILFMDHLPKTGTDKIDRQKLRHLKGA